MKQKITFLLLWLMMISSYKIYGQREKEKGQRMNNDFDYSNVYVSSFTTLLKNLNF